MDPRSNVISHLEELRKRLIVCAAALAAAGVACWFFSAQLLDWITAPAVERVGTLYYLSPSDAFMARVRTALFGGLILASPVLFSQVWSFVAPGLQEKERRMVVPAVVITTALFLTGAAFAFWLVVPATFDLLLNFGTPSMEPMITLGEYVGFVSGMVFSFAIAFDLPVFVAILAKLGIVNATFLRKYRRHCYVALFVAAAILTPSPDALSMLMLGIPLLLLYEASIFAAVFIRK